MLEVGENKKQETRKVQGARKKEQWVLHPKYPGGVKDCRKKALIFISPTPEGLHIEHRWLCIHKRSSFIKIYVLRLKIVAVLHFAKFAKRDKV